MKNFRWFRPVAVILTVAIISACTHLGPRTVPRDRFDYNTAISSSWKEQTLLNIVKVRYADMPLFVEVASVVSGYTLEGTVSVGGTITDKSEGDLLSLGGSGKYTDRPTITYAPITGQKFNKSFMTPIPPQAILFLMHSNWPADLIFPLTVDSVNGIRGEIAAGSSMREADEKYARVVSLLRMIQKSGAVGMRIIHKDNERDSTVMFFYREGISSEVEAALIELNGLLGLGKDAQEVKVSYGLLPSSENEISMLTRSMLQILIVLATQIDVPDEHVASGSTVPSLPKYSDSVTKSQRLINISHSEEKPPNSFVAVKYRDHWFSIDDRDFYSKRTFTFLMILFSLTESGGKEGLPLVTIPAG